MFSQLIITILLNILLINMCDTTKMITDNQKHLNSEVTVHSATEIANENFDYRGHTVIITKDIDPILIDIFLRFYRGTVMVDINRGGTPKQVVIIVENYYSFISILGKLKPDLKGKTLLHSGAKFLIVILSHPHRLERLNNILWNYYTTDIVILVRDDAKNLVLYNYIPYKNHLNCQNVKPALIGIWDEGRTLQKDIYFDKMSNMKGCPLYISTDKLFNPLTDQKIALQLIKKTVVRLLRDTMNFTPIISNRDYVSIDSGTAKNWSDALDDVITGTANISTCTVSLGIERTSLLDYSIPYFGIRLAWLAPPPEPGPIWWRLYSPLNGYLWLILLLIVIFVKSLPFIVKFKRVKKFCNRYFRNFDKLRSVTLRSWGVLMGQPIAVVPRRFRDFYIVGLWIWFTFVIRSAYQSVLIGALKSEILIGKFTTIQDAAEHGYHFGGREDVLTHFEHEPFIRNDFKIIPDNKFLDSFREVVNGKSKFVFAIFLEYAWGYCLSEGLSENECGYVIPDSIMTAPLVIWMKTKSPFQRSISIWLHRFIESGLLEKETMNNPLMSPIKILEPSPLTRDQMLSCVMCLVLGYLVCGIVFVLEIISIKTKTIRNIAKINMQSFKFRN